MVQTKNRIVVADYVLILSAKDRKKYPVSAKWVKKKWEMDNYEQIKQLIGEGISKKIKISIRTITPQQIRRGELDKVDVLFIPGGCAKADMLFLEKKGRRKIKEFVYNGGGYVGICAGAMLPFFWPNKWEEQGINPSEHVIFRGEVNLM